MTLLRGSVAAVGRRCFRQSFRKRFFENLTQKCTDGRVALRSVAGSSNSLAESPLVEDRQKMLLSHEHGSLQRIKQLMEASSPAARRRTLLETLETEHTVQHAPRVLARFFDEEPAEGDDLSTCSISAPSSAASSLDEHATSPVRSAAVSAVALDQSRCYSPYYMDRSALVSPEAQQEQPAATVPILAVVSETEGKENNIEGFAMPTSRRSEALVRRKSRQMIQKLQNLGKKKGFRKSEQPDESEMAEDDLAVVVESLRKEVAVAEEQVLLAEKNILATLRTERERLEMRARMLQADVETRHVISDHLSKQQAMQQSRRMVVARPKTALHRVRSLEETVMREWTLLPQDALRITCAGARVRRWLGGQAARELQQGRSSDLSSKIVLCCVLQYLAADDVASLKQTCRLNYNICSLYFRAKPISDLSVELLNSEAMYNAYLSSFLSDYRDAIAIGVPSVPAADLEAVFGPIERITNQSVRVLGLLQAALATAQPFRSDVGACFVQVMEDVEKDYAAYCESYHSARSASEALLAQKGVLEVLGKETSPLTLDSFLIMPVQRVPRYLLMVQSMLRKMTSPRMPSHESLLLATELLQSCAASINRRMQDAEDASRLEKFFASVADAPQMASGTRLVAEQTVAVNGKVALLVLLNDRILVAQKNIGKSTAVLTAPWRFRSMHVLQNCHARMFDDPRVSKVQIMTDEETLMCVFDGPEEATIWLGHFSTCLVEQLKYHPRSAKGHKLATPRMTLTRFSELDGQVLVRPVVPRVVSVSTQHAFVLDAENKLFLYCGRNSSPAEVAMAEEYIHMVLADADTRAMSVVRVVDEKKGAHFFELLGGDAALVSRETVQLVAPPHLSIFQDQLAYPRPSLFSFASLPENGCALLDARFGPCFIWAALHSSPALRDRAIRFAQDAYSGQQDRPVEFVLAGAEPALFKMLFHDWPLHPKDTAASSAAATVAVPTAASNVSVQSTPLVTPATRKKTLFATMGRKSKK